MPVLFTRKETRASEKITEDYKPEITFQDIRWLGKYELMELGLSMGQGPACRNPMGFSHEMLSWIRLKGGFYRGSGN